MRVLVPLAALVLAACGSEPDYFTVEELQDPENCIDCHPQHYREWSGSMHAYAADDPVFLAMNARGQEETGGELGDFCVGCHAPIAVRLGLTTDGLNLDEVPRWAKGVTCFVCHSVDSIDDLHNNGLVLATDGVMRGGLGDEGEPDAVASPRHRSAFSPLLSGASQESSAMCGSCHDVVTPAGVHLEKTFLEWEESVWSSPEPFVHQSCATCHMDPRTDVAAEVDGVNVPLRTVRDHSFPGIDLALTPFPEMEAQRESMAKILDPALGARLCVVPTNGGEIHYRLDNINGGHMWPSGAAHDRRSWAEVIAYDAKGGVLFQTGVVADGADPDPTTDANLWEQRELVFDDAGNEVLYFWEVRETDRSLLLPPAVTFDISDPRFDHSVTRVWPMDVGVFPQIARVTARVNIRPLPYAAVDDLIASGHLAPAIRDAVPTLSPGDTVLEWTPDTDDLGGCVR